MTCSDQLRNVVPLWRRKDQQMNAAVTMVMTHWASLRRGGSVPRRVDLDPQGLASALPNTFLLERPRADTVRFRLAGQHLHHSMGMDVRGMPLRAFFEISERKRLMNYVFKVFESPAILDLELVSDAQGRARLDGRMYLLPMTGANDAIDRALGVFVTDGLIGLPPRRFRIRHASLSDVLSSQDGHDRPDTNQLAKPDHPFRSRPSLTLLQGGLA